MKGGEEALSKRVVVTAPNRAHRDGDARLVAAAAEGQAGVLGAVVRMVDQTRAWPTVPEGHLQRAISKAARTSSARR